jgi:glucose/arabinose dehydrogenase
MKRPLLSTFCIALLLFTVCGYVAYFASVRLAFRHQQSRSFAVLGAEDGPRFRRTVEVLHAFEMSRILTRNTPDSLEQNIKYLVELRAKAPAEVIPIVDLRLATDHAVLSKLYESANKQTDAASHREIAQSMFRGLGWTDVSPSVVNEVADKQLQSRLAKWHEQAR